MQLERILRSQGFGSRAECRRLVWSGVVTIAGAGCDDPFVELEPKGLRFSVHGEEWEVRQNVYILLNKPEHYECSHKPIHYPSVYSLLPRPLVNRGVQAVGRLDEDTTGLLLLSDDGQFIHHFTSPKRKVAKVYEATTKHPVSAELLDNLRQGVMLNDEERPIAVVACEQKDAYCLRLTVTEGKYHLVKRLVAAAGNRVCALTRVAIGGLELPLELAPGRWRYLSEADRQLLSNVPRKTDSGNEV